VEELGDGVDVRHVDGTDEWRCSAALPIIARATVRSATKVDAEVFAAAASTQSSSQSRCRTRQCGRFQPQLNVVLVVNAPTSNIVPRRNTPLRYCLPVARQVPAADASLRDGQGNAPRFGY